MPCVLSEKARDLSQVHFSTHGQRSNAFCPFPFFYGLCLKLVENVHAGNSFCLSLALAALVPRLALAVHVT